MFKFRKVTLCIIGRGFSVDRVANEDELPTYWSPGNSIHSWNGPTALIPGPLLVKEEVIALAFLKRMSMGHGRKRMVVYDALVEKRS